MVALFFWYGWVGGIDWFEMLLWVWLAWLVGGREGSSVVMILRGHSRRRDNGVQ